MSVRNGHHDAVVAALIADGWIITHDPLHLPYEGRNFFVDIGAERTIGAEKGDRRVDEEIQSFAGLSEVRDLQEALGQYITYRTLLAETDRQRVLYMAVRRTTARGILAEPFGRLIVERQQLKIFVFDEATSRLVQWIE
jgi:XisH protein